MQIAWIYFAASILVLGYLLYLPTLPAGGRARITLALIGLMCLGRLTRDVVVPFDFNLDHVMSFGETLLVLSAIVAPIFRYRSFNAQQME